MQERLKTQEISLSAAITEKNRYALVVENLEQLSKITEVKLKSAEIELQQLREENEKIRSQKNDLKSENEHLQERLRAQEISLSAAIAEKDRYTLIVEDLEQLSKITEVKLKSAEIELQQVREENNTLWSQKNALELENEHLQDKQSSFIHLVKTNQELEDKLKRRTEDLTKANGKIELMEKAITKLQVKTVEANRRRNGRNIIEIDEHPSKNTIEIGNGIEGEKETVNKNTHKEKHHFRSVVTVLKRISYDWKKAGKECSHTCVGISVLQTTIGEDLSMKNNRNRDREFFRARDVKILSLMDEVLFRSRLIGQRF